MILPLLLFSVFSVAAEPAKFPPSASMNGYSLAQFPDFQTAWHFVTVRFRKDTGEMRFTYANDSAWKALLAGGKDYPEGAVFAKIGVATKDDPAFLSSAVPSGARRYQFMVRNRKKHANTDGWGYALFNQDGVTYPEDPKIQEQACAACHRLVPSRGYVFSERLDLTGITSSAPDKPALPAGLSLGSRKRSSLPPNIRRRIPDRFTEIYFLKGELQKYLFQGTLDEVRPLLTQAAGKNNAPAAIISNDQTRFSIVYPDAESPLCAGGKERAMRAISSTPDAAKVAGITFCYAR